MRVKSITLDDGLIRRFWRHVDRSGDCWVWTGEKAHLGYGRIRPSVPTNTKIVLAHRVSWVIHYGPIPEGKAVCHRCDNPPCVRPDHLFAGTQRENIRDMDKKGRRGTTPGEASGRAVLCAHCVRAIRESSWAQTRLGRLYGVTSQMIGRIRRRQNWKHVE